MTPKNKPRRSATIAAKMRKAPTLDQVIGQMDVPIKSNNLKLRSPKSKVDEQTAEMHIQENEAQNNIDAKDIHLEEENYIEEYSHEMEHEEDSDSDSEPDDDEEYLEYLLNKNQLVGEDAYARLYDYPKGKHHRAYIKYTQDFLQRIMNQEALAFHGHYLPKEWISKVIYYGFTKRTKNKEEHRRNVKALINQFNHDMLYKVYRQWEDKQDSFEGNVDVQCHAIDVPRYGDLEDIHSFHYALDSVRNLVNNAPAPSGTKHCPICEIACDDPLL